MTLLKPIHNISMLTLYEQMFIQTFHHNENLTTDHGIGKQNPLFKLEMEIILTSQIGTIRTPIQNSCYSPAIDPGNSNGYAHTSLFDRTF